MITFNGLYCMIMWITHGVQPIIADLNTMEVWLQGNEGMALWYGHQLNKICELSCYSMILTDCMVSRYYMLSFWISDWPKGTTNGKHMFLFPTFRGFLQIAQPSSKMSYCGKRWLIKCWPYQCNLMVNAVETWIFIYKNQNTKVGCGDTHKIWFPRRVDTTEI